MSEGEAAMSEIERQARNWWARLLAWLRGAQNGDAARKARETLQDVRTSDAGQRAESALRDLRGSDATRKAKEAIRDLRDSASGRSKSRPSPNPPGPRPDLPGRRLSGCPRATAVAVLRLL